MMKGLTLPLVFLAAAVSSWMSTPAHAKRFDANVLKRRASLLASGADAPARRPSPPPAPVNASRPALAAAAPPPQRVALGMAAAEVSSEASGANVAPTFRSFYDSHAGKGIWKWSNALDAYQRHFAPLANQPIKLGEVGVQSGGSLEMWHAVLGAQCYVFGLDINQATLAFQDSMTSITIGDQADVMMWQNFFTNVAKGPIDILVDDGGHEAHQMLTTLSSVFDNLTPGGMIAIEDIHGEHYVDSFFVPSAAFLGGRVGLVSSVHLYPFMLLVQRAGNDLRAPLTFSGSSEVVSEFAQLWAAIPRHPGGQVILENAGWGPFLTAPGLTNFFRVFGELHHSVWSDVPAGCERTPAPVCSVNVQNGPLQASISGVHIYATQLVVEVNAAPPVLQAVRRGNVWLPY